MAQLTNHVIPFLKKFTQPPFLPIEEAYVALLIVDRFKETNTIYSPVLALQAINWWHKANLFDPVSYAYCQQFLNGARRMLGQSTVHTVMVEPRWLLLLFRYCDRPEASTPERRLGNIANAMLGFCARKDDVLHLTATCIQDFSDRIIASFWTTKSDQYRSGHQKTVSKIKDDWGICARLKKYLQEIGLWDIQPSDPNSTSHIFLPAQYSAHTKRSTGTPNLFCFRETLIKD